MKENLRPCIVKIGEITETEYLANGSCHINKIKDREVRKAYFHRWHENRILNSCMLYGIVEFEDGSVHGVRPADITFSDRVNYDKNKGIISEGDICEFGKNEKVLMLVTLGSGSTDDDRYIEGFYLTGKNKGHIGRFNLKELRKTDKHLEVENILKNVCAE